MQNDCLSEFADTVRRYCSLIENVEDIDPFEFIDRCAQLLAELYMRADRLPVQEAVMGYDAPANPAGAGADDPHNGYKRLVHGSDVYRTTEFPLHNDDIITGSLNADLQDICEELGKYLRAYDRGTPEDIKAAAWYWKFSFMSYWGFRAAEALRVIHFMRYA